MFSDAVIFGIQRGIVLHTFLKNIDILLVIRQLIVFWMVFIRFLGETTLLMAHKQDIVSLTLTLTN